MRLASGLAGLAALFAVSQLSCSFALANPVPYRIVRGDTLETIASRYLVSRRTWSDLARQNRIAKPRRILPGQTLLIPRNWLRVDPEFAIFAAVRGPVSIEQDDATARPAVGQRIKAGVTVVTGAAGYATLSFPDGSLVSVLPQSVVRISDLGRIALTGGLVRTLAVEKGKVESGVVPFRRPDDSYRILTPLAVASVRGTKFRVGTLPVGQNAAGLDQVEVLEGHVNVEAEAAASLEAGQGVLASSTGLGEVRPLLPAPRLIGPGRLQEGPLLRFAMAPQTGASAWHLTLASDAGFVDRLDDALTTGEPAIEFPSLPDGTYFIRVAAVSPEGLEGLPRDYAFRRERYSFGARTEREVSGSAAIYRFRWQAPPEGAPRFRFVLWRLDVGQSPPLIDEPSLSRPTYSVLALPPGRYGWRVGRWIEEDGGKTVRWDAPQELTIAG